MAIPRTETRLVLEGVPRIGFYDGGPRCPEDIPLPAVMRALMEYFNEPEFGCRTCRAIQPGCKVHCTYSYFVGMTGAGSFLSWKKGWHEDNVAIFYMDADAGITDKRAFWAAGYEMEYVGKEEGWDETYFRQRIIESIQRGVPVMAYGVIGPPESCIITGYGEGGETLIGWNFFQGMEPGIELEPDGQFRKRDWFDATACLYIIKEKQPKPPLKELYLDALKFAVKISRTPMVHPEADAPEWYRERANGLAAYDAWAEQLLRDEDFPDDETVLRQRYDVHNSAVGQVAEARWYGNVFFTQAAIEGDALHYSLVEDVLHAAACYAAEHDLMWKIWNLAGGIDNPEAYKLFADPAVRRQMIPIIQEARRQDEQAVRHLENALAKPQAR